MSRSIHDTVLYSLVKDTFSLLLDNENRGDESHEEFNLDKLVTKLDEHTEQLRTRGISNDLLSSLIHLKSALVSLRACFENHDDRSPSPDETESRNKNELQEAESDLKEDRKMKDQGILYRLQNRLYTSRHTHLENEVSQIQFKQEFTEAMKCFSTSKNVSAKVFEDENKTETKITATKVRVISEILGNLTNLRDAATECLNYISKLHGIFKLQNSPFPKWRRALSYAKPLEKIFESEDMKCLDSALHINAVVFRFVKEFITKPVAMLDWTTIPIATHERTSQKILHPLLGTQPSRTIMPNPFIDIEEGKEIDSQVCAVNCNGEVFTKEVTNSQTNENSPTGMTSKE